MYKKQDAVVFSLCILLACQMVSMFFVPQQEVLRASVSLLAYTVCMCIPTVFLSFGCTTYKDKMKLPERPFVCAVFCAGVIYFGNVLSNLIAHFFEYFDITLSQGVKVYTDPWAIAISFVNLVILPPILEELFVRRYILSHILPYSKTQAVIFSSLVFGFFHMNLMQIPFAVMCGFVFGYFTVRTQSIKFSVMMHFLNNLSAFAVTYVGVPNSRAVSYAVGVVFLITTAVTAVVLYKHGYFREKMKRPVCSAMTMFYFAICIFVACASLR